MPKRRRPTYIQNTGGTYKRSRRASTRSTRAITKKPTRYGGYFDGEVKYEDKRFAQFWNNMEGWKLFNLNTTTGSSEPLNGISQNDNPSSRDGRKIGMKSLHIRASLELCQVDEYNKTATEDNDVMFYDDQLFRFVIVMDTQANKAVPVIGEIFKADGDVRFAPLEFRNLEWSGRFKVLYDKVHKLTRSGNFGFAIDNEGVNTVYYSAPHSKKFVNINLKLNEDVMYDGTGDTSGQITKNSIYAMGCRMQNHSSQQQPGDLQVFFRSRVRFVG